MISLLYPIVTDARMLAQTTGLPLLGTVTYSKTSAQIRSDRWRLASFSAFSCALLLVFVGVLAMPKLIA